MRDSPWIDCDVALPANRGEYVVVEEFPRGRQVSVLLWDGDWETKNVTHWMFPPELPPRKRAEKTHANLPVFQSVEQFLDWLADRYDEDGDWQ